MTLQQFDAGLKESCTAPVYQLAAPKGERRYVAWHSYGYSSSQGDDRNQINAPKVQIDIHTQSMSDTLVDEVFSALWLMDLPFSVQSEGYDDDYNDIRTILQLVVI